MLQCVCVMRILRREGSGGHEGQDLVRFRVLAQFVGGLVGQVGAAAQAGFFH